MDTPALAPVEPAPAAAPDVPPTDDHGRLIADIHCLQCGYNLRSLNVTAACPECGTSVGRSIRSDLLQFADPRWLASLTSGLRWMVLAVVFAVLRAVAFPLYYLTSSGGQVDYRYYLLASLLPLIMMLLGIWKFTALDPRLRDAAQRPKSRLIARIAQATSLGVAVVFMIISFPMFWFSASGLLMQAMGVVQQTAGMAALAAVGFWLSLLAARLPLHKLVRQARWVAWGLVIVAGLTAAVSTASIVAWRSQMARVQPAATAAPPPPYAVSPPVQATQVISTTLPDGTQRITYPENDPASPNPAGVTTVDTPPGGDTRTYTVVSLDSGYTMAMDTYIDSGGNQTITTTTTDASGTVVSQNTTNPIHVGGAFGTTPLIDAVRVISAVMGILWLILVIWGFALLVWFHRRLKLARASDHAVETA